MEQIWKRDDGASTKGPDNLVRYLSFEEKALNLTEVLWFTSQDRKNKKANVSREFWLPTKGETSLPRTFNAPLIGSGA